MQASAIHELGLSLRVDGDDVAGVGHVVPTMCVPGTDVVRTSVVMTWADALLGAHAIRALAPRLPVTLDLDVHLFDDIAGLDVIHARSALVKAGSSVIVTSLELFDPNGAVVGYGGGSFMAAPNPEFVAPPIEFVLDVFSATAASLTTPLAERIECTLGAEPGTAVLPCTPAVHNGSKAINGGLLAVAIEDAALAADPAARRIESMHVRYVRAIRTGPAIARADVHRGVGRVVVTDTGTDVVAAVATTRSA